MRILDAIRAQPSGRPQTEERFTTLSGLAQFMYDGSNYIVGPSGSSPADVDKNFTGYIQQIHERHGVVAAAVTTRGLLLSQVRFRFRDDSGALTKTRELSQLNYPGSRSRSSLLSLLEIDASYSGTGVVVKRNDVLYRLAPDKVSFVLGSNSEPSWSGDALIAPFDTVTVGILYNAGKNRNGEDLIESFFPGEFAVWAPEPDPLHPWRGTSWVSSVVRETLLDGQVTDHMGKYFEKATVPGLVFIMDPSKSPGETSEYAKVVNENFSGAGNRFKNMFLGGGTDVKVVGSSIKDLGLNEITGVFENRVAVRSRIPASVLGTKEALSGSSLNAGNYGAARRLLADGWFTPTVDSLCESLEPLVFVPDGQELSFDPGRVLFLQEDQKDAADILSTNSIAARQLVDGGFDPASVIEAVTTGDLSKLTHTGNVSVQLQPPGTGDATTEITATEADRAIARELAEIVQKVYLGVGVVLTSAEARQIVIDAGGKIPAGLLPVDPSKGPIE